MSSGGPRVVDLEAIMDLIEARPDLSEDGKAAIVKQIIQYRILGAGHEASHGYLLKERVQIRREIESDRLLAPHERERILRHHDAAVKRALSRRRARLRVV